jgi:hypothetical protein
VKNLLLVVLMCLSVSAGEVPPGNEEPHVIPVNQRRRILTQGCLIGGTVIILTGIGFGTGWVLDRSTADSSINIDIDLSDCNDTQLLEVDLSTAARLLRCLSNQLSSLS